MFAQLNHLMTVCFVSGFYVWTRSDLCKLPMCMYNLLEVASFHLQVNDLMERHSDLIGNFQCQSTIYASFFRLLCSTESFNVYMDVFNKYVPNTCIPDMSIVLDTLQAMELNDAIHYLPQLWSGRHANRWQYPAMCFGDMLSRTHRSARMASFTCSHIDVRSIQTILMHILTFVDLFS